MRPADVLRGMRAARGRALRAGVSVLVPLLAGWAAGRLDLGVVASVGAFAGFSAWDEPYRRRARVVAGTGAALTLAVALGTWAAGIRRARRDRRWRAGGGRGLRCAGLRAAAAARVLRGAGLPAGDGHAAVAGRRARAVGRRRRSVRVARVDGGRDHLADPAGGAGGRPRVRGGRRAAGRRRHGGCSAARARRRASRSAPRTSPSATAAARSALASPLRDRAVAAEALLEGSHRPCDRGRSRHRRDGRRPSATSAPAARRRCRTTPGSIPTRRSGGSREPCATPPRNARGRARREPWARRRMGWEALRAAGGPSSLAPVAAARIGIAVAAGDRDRAPHRPRARLLGRPDRRGRPAGHERHARTPARGAARRGHRRSASCWPPASSRSTPARRPRSRPSSRCSRSPSCSWACTTASRSCSSRRCRCCSSISPARRPRAPRSPGARLHRHRHRVRGRRAGRVLLWPGASRNRLPAAQAAAIDRIGDVLQASYRAGARAGAALHRVRRDLRTALVNMRAVQRDALGDAGQRDPHADRRWPMTVAIQRLAYLALSARVGRVVLPRSVWPSSTPPSGSSRTTCAPGDRRTTCRSRRWPSCRTPRRSSHGCATS